MNHLAICTCVEGYSGNPFIGCSEYRGKYSIILFDVVLEIYICNMHVNNITQQQLKFQSQMNQTSTLVVHLLVE